MDGGEFKSAMVKFQDEGAFIIPDEQKSLWQRMYLNKRFDAFSFALNSYLEAKVNNRTPQPAEISELYRNAVTSIDRGQKAAEPPKSYPVAVPAVKVKAIKETVAINTSDLLSRRGHNLCKRWRGYNGYDTCGRILGDSNFDQFTCNLDNSLKKEYGDVKTAVENEAYRLAPKYKDITIPLDVKARFK